MQLTDQDKAEIKKLLDAGDPLPDKYRFTLFREPHEAELIWPGKTHEVTNVVLPFQSIEQIDEPRAETAATGADLFTLDRATGRQSGGWTNKLIWGDNKLVLSSLKNGHLRREIENAGGLKLVYIDPPFDVGADFSYEAEIGDREETVVKEASVIEDVAYRDTWGRGVDSFIGMMFERLRLISDLLHSEGTIFVHCDYRVNAFIRLAMDEVFGRENIKNEIIWKYSGGRLSPRYFGRKHDDIYWFSKSDRWTLIATKYETNMRPPLKSAFLTLYGMFGMVEILAINRLTRKGSTPKMFSLFRLKLHHRIIGLDIQLRNRNRCWNGLSWLPQMTAI